MAIPSLLSRVIESQGQDTELVSIRERYSQVQVIRARPFTWKAVFGIGDELQFPS